MRTHKLQLSSALRGAEHICELFPNLVHLPLYLSSWGAREGVWLSRGTAVFQQIATSWVAENSKHYSLAVEAARRLNQVVSSVFSGGSEGEAVPYLSLGPL